MFMTDNRIRKFAGGWHGQKVNASVPFSKMVLRFLEELSGEIRKNPETAGSQEFCAFAFWCRRKQMECWKRTYPDRNSRLGWGMLYHIAPSNLPALFAYSMVMGMLAGNGNLIRISSRVEKKAAPLCHVIETVMKRPAYHEIYEKNCIFSCGHEEEISRECARLCDGRIIWGGDRSVQEIRKIPIDPGAPEIEFPDRYSAGIFDAGWMACQERKDIKELADRFYNDTYYADQNACSSPKMIFWTGWEGNGQRGIDAWWNAVREAADRYDLDSWKVSRKYEMLCFAAMEKEEIQKAERRDNRLYVIDLKKCRKDITCYEAGFGMFYQYRVHSLEEISLWIQRKVQTIVCAGIKPEQIRDMIIRTGAKGGDRIVPVGQALSMGLVWDGKDMIRSLSRQIAVM